MDRIHELESIIGRFPLNAHPFYVEWRAGTLPLSRLVDYSGEYSQFVATIAAGWDTIGEGAYAEEEREHEKFWSDFQTELGCRVRSDRPQTRALVGAAENLFQTRPEAIGALYAFEAQQPETSRSKLDGLNEHYSLSDKGKHYFAVHADDVHEVEDLKRYVQSLSDGEFARCRAACAIVSAAMWSALDGVYFA